MGKQSNKSRPSMFKGATRRARNFGWAGLVCFAGGTLVIAGYVNVVKSGDPLVTIGLPSLWLIVVMCRVAMTSRERDLAAFVELMKWQIAIGAAAAAIVAPIGLDAEEKMDLDLGGPVMLFLISSGFAAVGYALIREAFLQVQDAAAEREAEAEALRLGRQVAAALERQANQTAAELNGKIMVLRSELRRLDQPWWKRWR